MSVDVLYVRPGGSGWGPVDVLARLAARLLEDDGVTYNPLPSRGALGASRRVPGRPGALGSRWRLDPLPTVVTAEEWAGVERGVAQRALLLEAVLAATERSRELGQG